MKSFTKFFALYVSISCMSGDRIHAVSALHCVDLSIKAVALIAVAYGMCKIGSILSDIRDIQFEQLMTVLSNCSTINQDNVSVSYAQLFDEHIDQLQRDTHVHTTVSVVAPKDSINLESFQVDADLNDTDLDYDDEDDDFEDFE